MDVLPEAEIRNANDVPQQRAIIGLVATGVALGVALTATVLFAAGYIIDWIGLR